MFGRIDYLQVGDRLILIRVSRMGCCPWFRKSNGDNEGEYQILKNENKAKTASEEEEECQQIDVEDDDFFQKN